MSKAILFIAKFINVATIVSVTKDIAHGVYLIGKYLLVKYRGTVVPTTKALSTKVAPISLKVAKKLPLKQWFLFVFGAASALFTIWEGNKLITSLLSDDEVDDLTKDVMIDTENSDTLAITEAKYSLNNMYPLAPNLTVDQLDMHNLPTVDQIRTLKYLHHLTSLNDTERQKLLIHLDLYDEYNDDNDYKYLRDFVANMHRAVFITKEATDALKKISELF